MRVIIQAVVTSCQKEAITPSLFPSIIASSKARYLATLCSALYASEEPFDDFVKSSSTFLNTSHKAFESVWPYLKIMLETDDALFNIVSLSTISVKHNSSLICRATNA